MTTARPIFDPRGRWQATLHTLIDIEEQRQREASLRLSLHSEHALRRLSDVLHAEFDVKAAFQQAVEFIADEFGSPLVAIAHASRDHEEVVTVACAGRDAAADPERWRGRHPFPANHAARIAIEEKRPLVISDYSDPRAPEFGAMGRAVATVSSATVPITDHAAIGISRPQVAAIEDNEFEVLQASAELLARRWSELQPL